MSSYTCPDFKMDIENMECVTQQAKKMHIFESSVSYIYMKDNSDNNIERLMIGHKCFLS